MPGTALLLAAAILCTGLACNGRIAVGHQASGDPTRGADTDGHSAGENDFFSDSNGDDAGPIGIGGCPQALARFADLDGDPGGPTISITTFARAENHDLGCELTVAAETPVAFTLTVSYQDAQGDAWGDPTVEFSEGFWYAVPGFGPATGTPLITVIGDTFGGTGEIQGCLPPGAENADSVALQITDQNGHRSEVRCRGRTD